jgi:hypothetical protein
VLCVALPLAGARRPGVPQGGPPILDVDEHGGSSRRLNTRSMYPKSPATAYLESCDIWNQDYAKKNKFIPINILKNILDRYSASGAGPVALNGRLKLRRRDEMQESETRRRPCA